MAFLWNRDIMQKIVFILTVMMFSGFELVSAQELTWQDCLREAAKNHPDLIIAREGIVQEKADKVIAVSGALPQVAAEASATATESESSGASNAFNYGATGSQLIFDGLKTVNYTHAASENIKAAKKGFEFASATVRFRLREAFVNLLKAQELLNITEEIRKIRQNNLELIELRYKSGTEHKGAFLTAQANIAQAVFEINQAQRGLTAAQQQLIKELGRKEFLPVTVKGEFAISDAAKERPDFNELSEANPSFLKAVAQKNAAAFDVKSSWGDFWPQVSASGGVSESGGKWPPNKVESSIGGSVSFPLFQGGENAASLQRAKSVYREKQEQERSTKDGIILTLVQRWNDFQDAIEAVDVQKSFLDAAEERAKISKEQYSVGLISFDNWTIIEDDLVRNKKFYLNTQANALLAEANWVLAKGEVLEDENQ